jgi:hypothetical protein
MLAPVAVRFRPVAAAAATGAAGTCGAATAAAAIPLTAFLRGISLYTMHEIIKKYLHRRLLQAQNIHRIPQFPGHE